MLLRGIKILGLSGFFICAHAGATTMQSQFLKQKIRQQHPFAQDKDVSVVSHSNLNTLKLNDKTDTTLHGKARGYGFSFKVITSDARRFGDAFSAVYLSGLNFDNYIYGWGYGWVVQSPTEVSGDFYILLRPGESDPQVIQEFETFIAKRRFAIVDGTPIEMNEIVSFDRTFKTCLGHIKSEEYRSCLFDKWFSPGFETWWVTEHRDGSAKTLASHLAEMHQLLSDMEFGSLEDVHRVFRKTIGLSDFDYYNFGWSNLGDINGIGLASTYNFTTAKGEQLSSVEGDFVLNCAKFGENGCSIQIK